jgi:hypothetical protein
MSAENWCAAGVLIAAAFLKLWIMYRDERRRRIFLETDLQIRIMRGVDSHPLRDLFGLHATPAVEAALQDTK